MTPAHKKELDSSGVSEAKLEIESTTERSRSRPFSSSSEPERGHGRWAWQGADFIPPTVSPLLPLFLRHDDLICTPRVTPISQGGAQD